MGLKKLNSEYNARYKTFSVHRPVTTQAKISSHPTDNAPEALESSRRAGLLSNQFKNVSEPALQRRRIVPYKHNHNILSTTTVKELNDKDWLEAVGNGDGEHVSASSVKAKDDAKKTEDTEYSSCFAKLKVEKDSPIIVASKAKMKQKSQDDKKQIKSSAAQQRTHIEKSPEALPPAGIPTYIADPQDKRLLRPTEDSLYPVRPQEDYRHSQTEYSERYKSSTPANGAKKPLPLPTNDIDVATYKKVLLQRNDAYGLSARPSTPPSKQQSSPKRSTREAKHKQKPRARRHSLDSKNSGSYISERRGPENGLAKTYAVSKIKNKDDKLASKKPAHVGMSPPRSLDEDSLFSIRSAHHLESTRKSKKEVEKRAGEHEHHEGKHMDLYARSVSSRNSQSSSNYKAKHKEEKLIPAETRPKSAKNRKSRRDFEQESVSSIQSARSFENITRQRSEKLQSKKRSRSTKNDKSGKQAWREKVEDKRGSRRISRDTDKSNEDRPDRGRSPTPEMRTAGQSRRHHLDITTGSNNPLATGPDPRRMPFLGGATFERTAYDPAKYSDVGESLTSSRSYATWSDRGL